MKIINIIDWPAQEDVIKETIIFMNVWIVSAVEKVYFSEKVSNETLWLFNNKQ